MKRALAGFAFLFCQTIALAAGDAEPARRSESCADISGDFQSKGPSDSKYRKEDDILGVAFGYSLPENPGDPRAYAWLLALKYDRFRASVKEGDLRIALFNAADPVMEFGFAVTCTDKGWRSQRLSKRYLDGYTTKRFFESSFALGELRSLTVVTRAISRGHTNTVAVQFARLP